MGELLVLCSSFTNITIVVVDNTNQYLLFYTEDTLMARIIIIVITVSVLLLLKCIVSVAVPGVPKSVATEMERRAFDRSQVLKGIKKMHVVTDNEDFYTTS